MFESMPEGGTTTVKSGKFGPYNQIKREAKTRWVLNPRVEGCSDCHDGTCDREGPRVVVDLTTYHHPESKVLSTSLTWGTVEPAIPGSAFTVETWASDHSMVRVHGVPVARYSQKALEDHHEYAMSVLANRWDHFRFVFEEAAERNGLEVSA